MAAPLGDDSLVQWLFGIGLAMVSGVVAWLTRWNFRLEDKISNSRQEFSDLRIKVAEIPTRVEIDQMLDRQTRTIVDLMDARYGKRGGFKGED